MLYQRFLVIRTRLHKTDKTYSLSDFRFKMPNYHIDKG